MGAGRTPAADERLLRGKRGMEEDAPESGGEWVVWWETLLSVLGSIALLAIVISLLSQTIHMGIFAAVAESVADLAYNLAHWVTMKLIQVFFIRLKIWLRFLSPVSIEFLGFDFLPFCAVFNIVDRLLSSDFGIIDLIKAILTVIEQSTGKVYPTIWLRAIFAFLNL